MKIFQNIFAFSILVLMCKSIFLDHSALITNIEYTKIKRPIKSFDCRKRFASIDTVIGDNGLKTRCDINL